MFKTQLGITGLIVMYVGNLEPYQGIDLLLQSFALALSEQENCADLVIIGGDAARIEQFQAKSRQLGIERRVHFLGPRPAERLPSFLAEADILVSARLNGDNTPMKIYPYLHSGKPVLATNLLTHTQVLNEEVAMLAEPSPGPFSHAMLRLIRDDGARRALGMAGKRLAEEKFSYAAYRAKLFEFFDWLEGEIARQRDGVKAARPPKS